MSQEITISLYVSSEISYVLHTIISISFFAKFVRMRRQIHLTVMTVQTHTQLCACFIHDYDKVQECSLSVWSHSKCRLSHVYNSATFAPWRGNKKSYVPVILCSVRISFKARNTILRLTSASADCCDVCLSIIHND